MRISFHAALLPGLGFSLLMTALAASPLWEKLPDLPHSTGGGTAGVIDGKVTLVGGATWRDGRKVWLGTAQQFDESRRQWTARELLPSPHAHGLAATRGDALWLVGGTTGAGAFAGAWRLGPGLTVTAAPEGIARPAVISAGAQVGDVLVFAGGTDDVANMKAFTDQAFALDLATGRLESLPRYPAGPFGLAAATAADGELLVFGGAAWDHAADRLVDLAAAYAFDVSARRWRALRSLPVATRGAAAVALDARWIYVAGGYAADAGFSARAWLYDVQADAYRPALSLPVRGLVTLLVANGQLYCLGGEDRPRQRSAEAFRVPLDRLRTSGEAR